MATASPPSKLQKPNDNDVAWLLRKIWDRLNRRNEHFVGVLVGREGVGKSLTALKIASEIDPKFSADQVIFRLENFLEVLRDEEYQPGEVYVLDEAGVSLGNRTWQDRAQVLGNQALQLIRDHNIGLIFTLPRVSELDKQARGRLQLMIEITDKVEGEYVTAKPKIMDPDRTGMTDKVYQKYPRRTNDSHGRGLTPSNMARPVKEIELTPPDEELVAEYQPKKDEFQAERYEAAIQELAPDDEEDEIDTSEIATEIVEERLDDFVMEHPQNKMEYIDGDLIRADYDLSQSEAKQVKKLVEREAEL